LFGREVFEGFGGVGVFDVEVGGEEVAGVVVFENVFCGNAPSMLVLFPLLRGEPGDAVGEFFELERLRFAVALAALPRRAVLPTTITRPSVKQRCSQICSSSQPAARSLGSMNRRLVSASEMGTRMDRTVDANGESPFPIYHPEEDRSGSPPDREQGGACGGRSRLGSNLATVVGLETN
jgi:hypothetical protein